jgi:hypothetical protein
MKRNVQRTVGLTFGMAALSWVVAFAVTPAMAPAVDVSNKTNAAARVERGAYLVRTMGCNDCHTPWIMGPRGPEPDMSRALTGHPAEMVLPPPAPLPPGPWTWLGAATNMAFAGPWGVSFTANLTPDTGLGNWTEDTAARVQCPATVPRSRSQCDSCRSDRAWHAHVEHAGR